MKEYLLKVNFSHSSDQRVPLHLWVALHARRPASLSPPRQVHGRHGGAGRGWLRQVHRRPCQGNQAH